MIECNLEANRIGRITVKNLYDFKLALNEATQEFEVTSNKDGFRWGAGKSTKGAMISAMRQGIQLRNIDISEAYVPIKEVIKAVKD